MRIFGLSLLPFTSSFLTVIQIVLSIFLFNSLKIDFLAYFGIFLFFVGGILFFFSPMKTLRKYGDVFENEEYHNTKKLVSKDLYSVVRHPQYLSVPIENISLIFISQNIYVFVLGIVSMILMHFNILDEDKSCHKKFDGDYVKYSKNVPMTNIILGFGRLLLKQKNKT